MKIDNGTLTQVTEQDINPDGTFVIPAGVTAIGDHAFHYCAGLTTLTIPDSVTTIGDSAFSGCSGLSMLTIPNSVTIIGSYAFWDCIRLTTLTVPDSVTTIGDNAFRDCSGLSTLTIPDGVTTIADNAFSYWRELTTLTIPDSVIAIGDDVFYDCDALEHIYVRQTQKGGLERIRDLLPAHLRDKIAAVSPAGCLTKRAGTLSTVGSDELKMLGLFEAAEPALPLATLLEESEKQISTPGKCN